MRQGRGEARRDETLWQLNIEGVLRDVCCFCSLSLSLSLYLCLIPFSSPCWKRSFSSTHLLEQKKRQKKIKVWAFIGSALILNSETLQKKKERRSRFLFSLELLSCLNLSLLPPVCLLCISYNLRWFISSFFTFSLPLKSPFTLSIPQKIESVHLHISSSTLSPLFLSLPLSSPSLLVFLL